jgi:carbonic anhydrase/acetyltransferase-like protein (isoleucine patch superfamily)
MFHQYNGNIPEVKANVFLAPGSQVIGDVFLAEGVSIWHNTVARGDMSYIRIGSRTNIQENSTLHVDVGQPLIIGSGVTVGHGAILHGCTVEDNCLIGMGAIVLNGAVIGKESIIGAGALVPENKEIPPRSLVLGVPGKVIRELKEEEIKKLKDSADHYYQLAQGYLAGKS